MTEASSLTPRFPVFLHGGDYNPDQWLDHPEILEQDIELMHKAHVNCVSIAIFAWARLEPEDGVYDFAWLDEVIDRLWRGGIHIILATPSGARPAWMAQKYPEVLRVNQHYERTAQSLPDQPGLPPQGTGDGHGAGAAVCASSGSHPLAPVQRVFRRLLLPAVSGKIPPMAEKALWNAGKPQSGVVDIVLEPPLHRLVAGGSAR